MSLPVAFDRSLFTSAQADELESIFAAIQGWSASPSGLALPTMRVYLSANQSIANGADPATVIFNSTAATVVIAAVDVNLGQNTGIDLNTSTGIVTLKSGRYHVQASVVFAANATGFRYVGIFETQYGLPGEVSLVQLPASSAGNQIIIQVQAVLDVPVNSTYRYFIGVFQSSGGALNVLSDARNTWFAVTKLA